MAPRVSPMPRQQLARQQGAVKSEQGVGHYGSGTQSYATDSMDGLSKNFSASAAIVGDRKSPGIQENISRDNRIDYTDFVKRKYFEQAGHSDRHYPTNFAIYREENGHEAVDQIILPAASSSSDRNSLSSVAEDVGTIHTRLLDANRISNLSANANSGNKPKLQVSEDRMSNRTKPYWNRPHTPPLTLYANEGTPALSHSSVGSPKEPGNIDNDNPAMDEVAGYLSPSPDMEATDSLLKHAITDSSAVSTAHPLPSSCSEDITVDGSHASVDSSRGSMSTATLSLIKQPVLYSAIGSLERANCNSLTNLNKRFLTPSKEFCKPGGPPGMVQSILVPPARPYRVDHNKQQKTRTTTYSGLQGILPGAVGGTDQMKDQQRKEDIVQDGTSQGTTHQKSNNTKHNSEEETNLSTLSSSHEEKSNPRKRSDNFYSIDGNLSSQDNTNATIDTKASNPKKTSADLNSNSKKSKTNRKVRLSYDSKGKTRKSKSKTIEMFRPSSDAYTPRIERKKIKYKAAEARPCVQQMSSPMGTLQRPNFRDALRRVAMILQRHIVKIESRFDEHQRSGFSSSPARRKATTRDGLFHASMREVFNEDAYRTPTFKCNMARIPMARPGMVYGLRKIKVQYSIPTETEIYEFGHQLFKSVQLSSECSIVCLIYVERLMEVAKVPLLACTWRPIFMCGLLLASKVWQDLSSWNIEFSSVYPQFSLEAINKLELNFLRSVKWDLYISSSSYAKYYFALRSLVEKQDFRQRYNRMVGGVGNVAQDEALKVQERTERVKEEAMMQLSRSMNW